MPGKFRKFRHGGTINPDFFSIALYKIQMKSRHCRASLQLFRFFRRHGICAAVRDIDLQWRSTMIRKLASGGYRLYSVKKNAKTGKRRNLGTFSSRAAARGPIAKLAAN